MLGTNTNISAKLRYLGSRTSYLEGMLDQARLSLAQVTEAHKDAKRNRQTQTEAEILLDACAEDMRGRIQGVVSYLGNACLVPLFGPSACLSIDYNMMPRGGMGAKIQVSVEKAKGDPLDSFGGSIVDTLSVALRAAYLILLGKPRILILDEPYRNLAAEYVGEIKQFLRYLVDKQSFQIIMITHREELEEIADIIIRIKQDKGISYTTKE